MSVPYNHHEVEEKWQAVWDNEKAFKTSDDYTIDKKLNFEQRCRQFRKNFPTTVQYLLNVLLLMTIIINGSGKSS